MAVWCGQQPSKDGYDINGMVCAGYVAIVHRIVSCQIEAQQAPKGL